MRRVLILGALALSGGLLPLSGGEPARCETRRPAADAWAARQAAPSARGTFLRAASVRAETQTDVGDLLLAFDESASRWLAANGKGRPIDYARACVRKLNDCLEASRLREHVRFRLAAAVQIDADLSSRQIGMGDILDQFIDDYGDVVSKGVFRKVTDRRESSGADIVSVLVAKGPYGIVGMGYSLEDEGDHVLSTDLARIAEFGDWAYNVCSIEAADEDFTQVHEIGHNMGAGHPDRFCADARQFEVGPQLFPYSSGYYLWSEGVGYHTIMAYNFGGRDPQGRVDAGLRFRPLPYFSSPEIYWNNLPVGTQWNDNRRTLLEAGPYVASYRCATLPVGAEGVSDEENAAAERAWYGDAGEGGGTGGGDVDGAGVTCAGFTVKGAFLPARAVNGQAPFAGAVYSNGVAVGTVQLKVGKANVRRQDCRIGGTMTFLDGRKYTVRTTTVAAGTRPQHAEGLEVKGLGRLDVWLGANGFAGILEGAPGGELEVRTCPLDARLSRNPASFGLEATAADLTEALGAPVLEACLPRKEPVAETAAGKWKFRPASAVTYRAVRDAATGEKTWILAGLDDPKRPNHSGLKLSCAVKNATFKGAFVVYLEVGTPGRPKLRKRKLAVTGVVVEGEGRGCATAKGVGSWPVTVR